MNTRRKRSRRAGGVSPLIQWAHECPGEGPAGSPRSVVGSRQSAAGRWHPSSLIRRGASLIELVVAMGFASVVVAVGAGLLHLLMNSERNLSGAVQQQITISRMSERFRDDVRHAAAAELQAADQNGASPRLVLRRPDGSEITWRPDGNVLTRREAGNPPQVEQYRLPLVRRVQLEFEQDSRRARLIVSRGIEHGARDDDDSQEAGSATQLLRIDATLARYAALDPPDERESNE